MPSDVENLKATRSNLITILKTKTDEWVASGCPATYSIDGESVQWNDWVKSKSEEIQSLTQTIQLVSGPFVVYSKGKA